MKNQHNNRYSRRRLLFIAFPPLAAVFFALALTMPALASTVFNVTFPVSGSVINFCNGEVVAISGNEHDTFNLTSNGSGGLHEEFHVNFENVTGTGSFGNTYQRPFARDEEFNTRVGQEFTFTETFNINSQGSAPNFLAHVDNHFTINPDGTVTSFHDNFSSECQG